jgi:monoamine oxidase
VLLNHKATAIHDDPAQSKIRVEYTWADPLSGKTGTGVDGADFCISTMAPNLLATIPTSLPEWFRAALAAVAQTPAIKVGWQGRTRFWETESKIYGGISWTDDIIGQIWYPSEDFTAHTGVLTGAYNRGPMATVFGQYSQSQRLQAALNGGEKLHAGFSQKVYADKGVTVAWQFMPNQVGGWAADTAASQPEVYRKITTLPQGRLYLAGDAWSYLPGWQEGAVTSAYAAVKAMAYGLTVGDVETVP